MTTYISESLENINKKELIPIILWLQNKLKEVSNSMLVEMHKLNEYFSKLEAELSVTKQANTLLYMYLGFLSRKFTIHRTAGEEVGYFLKFSLQLPPPLQTRRY